jgi:hypothetical protein
MVENRDNGVTLLHGQGPTGAKVLLHVNKQQAVPPLETYLSHGSSPHRPVVLKAVPLSIEIL